MKQADGVWRAAVNRHNQLVANVLKLRESLSAAEAKEAEAALAVAKAEAIKKKAATALAQAEGIGTTTEDKSVGAKEAGPGPVFSVQWDPLLFQGLEEL
eukprot:9069817-Pyramimonas_sp.AAC.1